MASREKLLAAAQRVFARQGYHSTMISDIVTEAGFGQGTYYRHFDDKREIFEALLDRFTQDLFSQFSEMSLHLPTNEAEYREASIKAIQRLAEVAESHQQIAHLFMTEAPTIDEAMAAKVAALYDGFASLAKSYLDHAITSGFARPCNSTIVAQALIGIAKHVAQKWLTTEQSDQQISESIRELVDFAFLGFGETRKK